MALNGKSLDYVLGKHVEIDSNNIPDDVVIAADIADDSITAAKIADDAVETAKIKDVNVTTAKIADSGVTFAKAAIFISTEQTGNGSEQSVAHGLGATPAGTLVVPTEFTDTTSVDIAEGTHTSTNVLVTVTNGVKYKVLAWA